MREKIIIALDVDSEEEALCLVEKLHDLAGAFKVGLQLYSRCGPGIVRKIREAGGEVFLDLKFHDIPNTVARATESVVGLGAFMLNFHAVGGKKMLTAAATAARRRADELGVKVPLLLGVTVLTSMSEQELRGESGVLRPLTEQVTALAAQCQERGLDGVVASAREIPWIRRACGEAFVIVTPGVRPAWAAQNDQQRVVTPKEAFSLGADYIVVGRPVTAAKEQREAAKRLLEEAGGR
ncbi:MAG: orotidine-5'-phosphate decarboxylase [Dethiobacter sp.]|nr:orotidine-5'-phosphate decarboxylase [Dethiobacter sp.]MCL5981907.1 orotidine-5'-phosphate decarboxylase [Bacillota bacterium]